MNGLTIAELDDLADAAAIEAACDRWVDARARRRLWRARLRWLTPWPLAAANAGLVVAGQQAMGVAL